MGKVPSPCIDVCKYKNRGYCIGCGMTKPQKKEFKKLSGRKAKAEFLEMLVAQQRQVGRYLHWEAEYRRKCAKKGIPCPLDEMSPAPAEA